MEKFFSRYTRPPKVQSTSEMQVARFTQSWNAIKNIDYIDDKSGLDVHNTQIPDHLKTMVDLLVEEEIRLDDEGSTGPCMDVLIVDDVLGSLVEIASNDFPDGIRGEVIRALTNMIDLLDERFLVHGAVFKPTLKLIRTSVEDPVVEDRYHEDLVDLMYVICSKIHGFHDLLNIFFHDRTWLTTPQKRTPAKPIIGHTPYGAFSPEPTRRILFGGNRSDEESEYSGSGIFSGSITSTGISPPKISSTSASVTTATADDLFNLAPGTPAKNIVTFDLVAPVRTPTQATPPAPDYEFLLFTYLLRFLHREGKAGDYARTALLFIVELAEGALGEFVLHASSFPAVAAAAVGALYSQLPRNLPHFGREETGDMDEEEEEEYAEEFRQQLDGFTKSLNFCQDVIQRCPMPSVGEMLLRHLRAVFLENILWPSLQGCSDADGSAEAVITYMDIVLRSLNEPNTTKMVLEFLHMPLDTEVTEEEIMSESDEPEYGPSEGFDLRRLIYQLISSESDDTLTATLGLLQTIFTKHCGRARRILGGGLVQETDEIIRHGVKEHQRELDMYTSVLTALEPIGSARDVVDASGYEKYLFEAELVLDQHAGTHYSPKYYVDPRAVIPGRLMDLLGAYFENSRSLNLALSGVMAALAQCPCRDLDGWLACEDAYVPIRANGLTEDVLEDSDDEFGIVANDADTLMDRRSGSLLVDGDRASIGTEATAVQEVATSASPSVPPPPIYRLLELLTAEVAALRDEFPEFDAELLERRRGIFANMVAPAPEKDEHGDRTVESMMDATIMLQEMVKEWLSLLQARRGLGVDRIRYTL